MPRLQFNHRHAKKMAKEYAPELVLKFVIAIPISVYEKLTLQAKKKKISIAEHATQTLKERAYKHAKHPQQRVA